MTAMRLDRIDAPTWMTSKFEKTPEGYLRGRAVVSNTGVFPYIMADGSIIYELRLPEEVFAKDSLDSLRLKPLTNDHPPEFVTAENVKEYQVGNLGDTPSQPATPVVPDGGDVGDFSNGYQYYRGDNYHLSIDMIIQDKDAIEDALNGKRELSCGYTCELEDAEPGARWCGVPYDKVQRKIRYNHVALVEKARAGDAARIRIDSADAIMQSDYVGGNTMPDFKSVKLDGVEYQAEGKVLEALYVTQSKVDGLVKDMADMSASKEKIEAERDTLKDRVDALDAEIKEIKSKKLDEAVIASAVARRVRILDTARLAEVAVADEMSELDIQKAVIIKVFPKANLDGKSVEYIDARFDGALETLTVEADADAANRAAAGGAEDVGGETNTDTIDLVDSRKAREKMIADLRVSYRGENK